MRQAAYFSFIGFLFIGLFIGLNFLTLAKADEIQLPAIVEEGSFADGLAQDPVLPVREGSTAMDAGSGAIQRSLQDQMPFHLADQGRAGTVAQFRGLGGSPEDTDVQALGVPLNSPQGGGYDLSIFPQYIWSGYRFQLGPSSAAFDPRGVSGTLTLIPWTAQALAVGKEGSHLRLTQFYSDHGVRQLSDAVAIDNRAAAVIGISDGDTTGPSGVLSSQWGDGRTTYRFHLLATRLVSKTPGPITFPTPRAHQLTARVIPIAQADFHLSHDALVRTSFFYDGSYIRYEDPDAPYLTGDHVNAAGTENTLILDNWKFRLGARHVTYKGITFEAPNEDALTLQGSRLVEFSSIWFEPMVQAVGDSTYGFFPGGGLGARAVIGSNEALYSRFNYSNRFPSLVDRYYNSGTFNGNPRLQVEHDWTGTLGVETKHEVWEATLEGYAQFRQNAQVAVLSGAIGTVGNAGDAWVTALTGRVLAKPWNWLDVSDSVTLAQSRVFQTGLEFPYVPRWVDVLAVEGHAAGDLPAWSAGVFERVSSGAVAYYSSNTRISGYGYTDLEARARVLVIGKPSEKKDIELSARIEDLFDRPIEFVQGYPTPGRVFSVSLVGEI